MTSTEREPTPPTNALRSAHRSRRRRDASAEGRVPFRVAAAFAVLPIAVSAVRHGLAEWVPVGDAATTAVRANDVFSDHFPLVGMWSAASGWAGRPINFPGALQLYFMAVPMRLLGNTWGVLLGVAAINTASLLTACWLIRRRVGYRNATVACVFIASFVWTLGSEVLVDMTPMQMVTVPCMLLFVAAWAVADGDLAALPILALVANYLVLDHLTLSAVVPTMVVLASGLLLVGLRAERKHAPDQWARTKPRFTRALGIALLISALAWTPPLIQQFTGPPPHNLTNLYEASKIDPPRVVPWGEAISAVGAVVAAPPWWLRPTFRDPAFHSDGTGRPALLVIGFAVALAALYATALVKAKRRGDRTVATGLWIAFGTVVAVTITAKKSTNMLGLLPGYLHSLWVSSVFVWMIAAVALVRLWQPSASRAASLRASVAPIGAAALTVMLSVLTFPSSDQGSGTWPWAVPAAKEINAEAIPQLRGRGPVLVVAGGSLEEGAIQSSLLLALQAEGIPFLLTGTMNRHQFGKNREFVAEPPNADIAVIVTNTPAPRPGARLIASYLPPPSEEDARFAADDIQVRAWLDRSGTPKANPLLARTARGLFDSTTSLLAAAEKRAHDARRSLADDHWFASAAFGGTFGSFEGSWLDTRGIDESLLRRWGYQKVTRYRRSFYVYLGPASDLGISSPGSPD